MSGMKQGHYNITAAEDRSFIVKETTLQFIFSHSALVDAEIMQGVIYNIDRDITLALIQIHEKTLEKTKDGNDSQPLLDKNQ